MGERRCCAEGQEWWRLPRIQDAEEREQGSHDTGRLNLFDTCSAESIQRKIRNPGFNLRDSPGKPCYRLCERGKGILRSGNEFMAYEARITCSGEGTGDGWVIELLAVTQFVTTGNPGGMEVGEVFDVLVNGGDDVALHDLHVIDIVEELETGMAQFLAEGDSPGGVITLVIGMVDLRIEEFHHENDLMLLGERQEAFQSGSAVVEPLLIRETVPVAAEGDDVGYACFCGGRDEVAVNLDQGVVVFATIKGALDAAETALVFRGGSDWAGEAKRPEGGQFLRVEKIDSVQAERHTALAEFLDGEIFEAPAAYRLGERHDRREQAITREGNCFSSRSVGACCRAKEAVGASLRAALLRTSARAGSRRGGVLRWCPQKR